VEAAKSTSRWERILPLALALLAVLIRLAPLLRSDLSFAFRPDDSFEYLQLADGLRHGCGFARLINGACGPREILRTPGYPLFLAIMPSVRWALAAQAILAGLLCLGVASCIARHWNFAAAITAELLIALDLPSLVMSNEIMSESLFQLTLLFAVVPPLLAFFRPDKAVVAAVVASIAGGCAILIRPIAIFLPVFLPIPFLLIPSLGWRRRMAASAIACGISALVLLGWSARNYEVARYPGLSTVSAINLYYYRAADVVARERGWRLEAARGLFGAELGIPYAHIYEAGVQSAELASRMNRLAMRTLVANPLQTIAITLQSWLYLAAAPLRSQVAVLVGTAGASQGDGLNAGAPSLGRLKGVLRLVLQSRILTALVLFEILLTALLWIGIARAVAECVAARAEYRIWMLYLAAAGAILLVLAAGGEADVRFRAPVIPLLAIVAALGYFPRPGGAKSAALSELEPPLDEKNLDDPILSGGRNEH
jgi:hypothetical protein